jgi:hypothetical protein
VFHHLPCEPMSVYRTNASMCGARDQRWLSRFLGLDGYTCTLRSPHTGNHVAGGDKHPVIYVWGDCKGDRCECLKPSNRWMARGGRNYSGPEGKAVLRCTDTGQ